MVEDNKRIICTGNPSKKTIANGVKLALPTSEFLYLSKGDDLRLWDDERRKAIYDKIKNYNVFINASKICEFGQLQLLNLVYETYSKLEGDFFIINIGSSAEYQDKFGMYNIEKNALKQRSLQLTNKKIRVSHLTIPGINDGSLGHKDFLPVEKIGAIIKTILYSDPFMSLVKLEP